MKNYFKINFLITLSFILFNKAIFSQSNNYTPFPETAATWIFHQYGPTGPNYGGFGYASHEWKRYQVIGDTTIGNYHYKKVYCANSDSNSYAANYPLNVHYLPNAYCFSFRNDSINKRVYIYTNIDGQEKDSLWYDFNLNVGDTLKKMYSFHNYMNDSQSIVTAIDSVLICGAHHKRYQFNCYNEIYEGLDLIEGVGFVESFISTSHVCPFEPVYLYGTSFSCIVESIKENNIDFANRIEIFPNPVSNQLNINNSKQNITWPINYIIQNCFGNKIIEITDSYNKSIDIQPLNNGFYILKIQDKSDKIYYTTFLKQ